MNAKKIDFQTADGVKIAGDFYDAGSQKSVLLLHILPGNRKDFSEFAELLSSKGFNVLNIDERGHGESEAWAGETGSWREYIQADYDKMIYDVAAAAGWLKNKIPATELAVIGGSIGANLALLYGAKTQPKIVIALSPGLDYHGVKTEIAARNYRQNLLLAASRDDAYSFESSEKLFAISKAARKEFIKYENAGHATRMLGAESELRQRIIAFLSKNF